MTRNARRLLWVLLAAAQTVTVAAQTSLDSAKELYASASYEAALTALTALNSSAAKNDRLEIDTYRALCFLALGRSREAESTLEQIVALNPTYQLDETELSPRIVAMFRTVRNRALPGAAQQLYLSAKGEYDGGNYGVAASEFKQVLALLEAPDAADQAAKLADLKELSSGFLALAEGKLAASVSPVPAARGSSDVSPVSKPAPAPAAVRQQEQSLSWALATVQVQGVRRPSTAAAPSTASSIYSLADTDVTPPVPIEQRMPTSNIPSYLRDRPSLGRLELLIDETGAVHEAALQKPIWPSFDAALIEAAKRWRYQPARRHGQPVKYRRFIDISASDQAR